MKKKTIYMFGHGSYVTCYDGPHDESGNIWEFVEIISLDMAMSIIRDSNLFSEIVVSKGDVDVNDYDWSCPVFRKNFHNNSIGNKCVVITTVRKNEVIGVYNHNGNYRVVRACPERLFTWACKNYRDRVANLLISNI